MVQVQPSLTPNYLVDFDTLVVPFVATVAVVSEWVVDCTLEMPGFVVGIGLPQDSGIAAPQPVEAW